MINPAYEDVYGDTYTGLMVSAVVLPLYFSKGVVVWVVLAAIMGMVVYKGGKLGSQEVFQCPGQELAV